MRHKLKFGEITVGGLRPLKPLHSPVTGFSLLSSAHGWGPLRDCDGIPNFRRPSSTGQQPMRTF